MREELIKIIERLGDEDIRLLYIVALKLLEMMRK